MEQIRTTETKAKAPWYFMGLDVNRHRTATPNCTVLGEERL